MCRARAPEASPCCFRIDSAGDGARSACVRRRQCCSGAARARGCCFSCWLHCAYSLWFVRSGWNLVYKTTLFKTWSRAEYVCRSPYVSCASKTCVVSGETALETFLRIRLWGKLLLSRLRSTFYSDRERLLV